ncbi:MAG: FAD-dependent oxidoreductase, partial [Nitrospirales bacterium]|nr:FAD-dependent oxidoreductase [Nitrospirales bacterium]
NGDEQGPIRTLCVLSEVAPSYAPPGRSLVSVSLSQQAATAGDETLKALWRQLREWFGDAVDGWRHLRTDRIVRALPPMAVLSAHTEPSALRLRPGLYRCGDYLGTGTLDAALLTGRVAAETLLADRDLS